jgi:hypothetical protein
MSFQVLWLPDAEQELAQVWMESSDRSAITRAVHRVENRLTANPANEGESRTKSRRIAFERPLAIIFRVRPSERAVEVVARTHLPASIVSWREWRSFYAVTPFVTAMNAVSRFSSSSVNNFSLWPIRSGTPTVGRRSADRLDFSKSPCAVLE